MTMRGMTEEDILVNAPHMVKLGEQEYPIKPLTLLKALEWRKKYGPKLSHVMASYGNKADTPEQFMTAFVDSAELMMDAVFSYMPELPRKTIMETCTEQQMFSAFTTVMGLAFGPFLGEVAFMTGFKRELEKVTSKASEPSSNVQ